MGNSARLGRIGPPANSSSPGAMTAADKAKVDGLASPSWLDTAAIAMAAAAPGVGRALPFDMRTWRTTNVVNPSNYAVIPGGGAVIQNQSTPIHPLPDAIVANPTAQPWAIRIRAKLRVPANDASPFRFGLGVDAVNFYALAEDWNPTNGATQLQLQQFVGGVLTANCGSGYVLDNSIRDYTLVADTSNLKVLVDDVVMISVPFSGHGPTGASYVFFSAAGYVNRPITDMAYAF
jgi:hypothetical protein